MITFSTITDIQNSDSSDDDIGILNTKNRQIKIFIINKTEKIVENLEFASF